MAKILVSACLAGEKCKYNGSHNLVPAIAALVRQGKAVAVCPEVLGGLPIPRRPAEIQGGDGHDVLSGNARVIDSAGKNVTAEFCRGANSILALARELQPELIVLKEKSPSCGIRFIYNGNFAAKIIPGAGVTAALLKQHGFQINSEKQFKDSRA